MTKLNDDRLRSIIIDAIREIYQAQSGDTDLAEMTDETVLLETGLDSLGFAILVTQLEEELDYDPFSLSNEAYYPQTLGEFVKFYRDNQPK